MTKLRPCDECNGDGGWKTTPTSPWRQPRWIACTACNGKGEVEWTTDDCEPERTVAQDTRGGVVNERQRSLIAAALLSAERVVEVSGDDADMTGLVLSGHFEFVRSRREGSGFRRTYRITGDGLAELSRMVDEAAGMSAQQRANEEARLMHTHCASIMEQFDAASPFGRWVNNWIDRPDHFAVAWNKAYGLQGGGSPIQIVMQPPGKSLDGRSPAPNRTWIAHIIVGGGMSLGAFQCAPGAPSPFGDPLQLLTKRRGRG